MENNQFAVDLDNVHSVLEIGQVCILGFYMKYQIIFLILKRKA